MSGSNQSHWNVMRAVAALSFHELRRILLQHDATLAATATATAATATANATAATLAATATGTGPTTGTSTACTVATHGGRRSSYNSDSSSWVTFVCGLRSDYCLCIGQNAVIWRVFVSAPDSGELLPRCGWVLAGDVNRCMICAAIFGRFQRWKVHCSSCGNIVCYDCSTQLPPQQQQQLRLPVLLNAVSWQAPHFLCSQCCWGQEQSAPGTALPNDHLGFPVFAAFPRPESQLRAVAAFPRFVLRFCRTTQQQKLTATATAIDRNLCHQQQQQHQQQSESTAVFVNLLASCEVANNAKQLSQSRYVYLGRSTAAGAGAGRLLRSSSHMRMIAAPAGDSPSGAAVFNAVVSDELLDGAVLHKAATTEGVPFLLQQLAAQLMRLLACSYAIDVEFDCVLRQVRFFDARLTEVGNHRTALALAAEGAARSSHPLSLLPAVLAFVPARESNDLLLPLRLRDVLLAKAAISRLPQQYTAAAAPSPTSRRIGGRLPSRSSVPILSKSDSCGSRGSSSSSSSLGSIRRRSYRQLLQGGEEQLQLNRLRKAAAAVAVVAADGSSGVSGDELPPQQQQQQHNSNSCTPKQYSRSSSFQSVLDCAGGGICAGGSAGSSGSNKGSRRFHSSISGSSRRDPLQVVSRATSEEVKLAAADDPQLLVGWEIVLQQTGAAHGGLALVTGIRKCITRKTEYSVLSVDGTQRWVRLQRSTQKSGAQYRLLRRIQKPQVQQQPAATQHLQQLEEENNSQQP